MNRSKVVLLGLVVPSLIVFMWWIATTYTDIPNSILPKISTVGKTFKTLVENGQITSDLKVSIVRVIKGFLFSTILGILLGSLMGMSALIRGLLQPIITVIRQIPIIAWIPLIILWCGIGESSKVVIIIIASFFPIMINTLSGISTTPGGFIEVAKLYKLDKWTTFTKVYLPHALPQILVGLKLGLGISWMAVVASELISATSGIGFRMSDARSLMRSDIVIVCMIVVGVVGIIMDKGLSVLFDHLTPWNKNKQIGIKVK